MSTFMMVPINANGIVVDGAIASNAQVAMSGALDLNDLFVYSHGWSTDASGAMTLYNRFSVEFMDWVATNRARAQAPPGVLSVGIHWPSDLTEDGGIVNPAFQAILAGVQPLTFYTMEKRADSIGTHGVYAVIRSLVHAWQSRTPSSPKLRVNLIGHSFGCKVVTSAVEAIYQDVKSKTLTLANVEFRLVLIQGAFENKQLDPHACYGDAAQLDLRMLVTKSAKDTALTKAFPLAHKLVDFFGQPAPALGDAGPSQATTTAFGGADQLDVGPGFGFDAACNASKRLVVADLTKLHVANPNGDSAWGGHHGDFNHPEVYALVAGFLL